MWRVETSKGGASARFLILATGCLSSPNRPVLPGEERFKGDIFHTGHWPHETVDFGGRRVAVIGTGSSAIQAIPVIARDAERLTVFQRTANYAVPAHNRPLPADELAAVKADYQTLREAARAKRTLINFELNPLSALEVTAEERTAEYEKRWAAGRARLQRGVCRPDHRRTGQRARGGICSQARIREQVDDPATAALLAPKSVFGCKRLCVETGYYETYNQPHVELVDISERGIETLTETGLRGGGA